MTTTVPISLIVADDNGLKMELIDRYIKERGENAEHKSMLSSLVGVNSKEAKIHAARRIKLYIEAGEDLSHAFNEVHSQLTDKGELRRIFDQYKDARADSLEKMNQAKSQLPPHLSKLKDPPVPVSIKNKHGVEKIAEYIESRSADPRETKGFGATLASLFGNDAYTKKGKLRAAKLLENGIKAGVPLQLVYNTEDSSLGDGTLHGIYMSYEKEQERLRKRLVAARKQLKESMPSSSPSSHNSSESPVTSKLRQKYT